MELIKLISVFLVSVVTINSKDYLRVCHLVQWSHFDTGDIDPKLCSHIVHNFKLIVKGDVSYTPLIQSSNQSDDVTNQTDDVNGTSGGGGSDDDESSSQYNFFLYVDKKDLAKLKEKKKTEKTLKILLTSVNGYDRKTMETLLKSVESRSYFVNASADLLVENQLNGLVIDLDYYLNDSLTEEERTIYNSFIKELFERYNKSDLILAATLINVKAYIRVIEGVWMMTKYLEFLTIKTFGYHDGSNRRGHNAPLFSSRHNSTVDYTVNYWLIKAIDPHKIVLGMEFYVRCYTLDKKTININYAIDKDVIDNKCPPFKDNMPISFGEICSIIGNPRAKRVWDVEEEVPYLVFDKLWVGFENPRSLMKKAVLMMKHELRGWAFWDFGLDDYKGTFCRSQKYPLLTALNKAVMDDFDFNETAKYFPEIPVGEFSNNWPFSQDEVDDTTGMPGSRVTIDAVATESTPRDDPATKHGGYPSDLPFDKTVCTQKGDGLHPVLENCRLFVNCQNGVAEQLFICQDMFFNPDQQKCTIIKELSMTRIESCSRKIDQKWLKKILGRTTTMDGEQNLTEEIPKVSDTSNPSREPENSNKLAKTTNEHEDDEDETEGTTKVQSGGGGGKNHPEEPVVPPVNPIDNRASKMGSYRLMHLAFLFLHYLM